MVASCATQADGSSFQIFELPSVPPTSYRHLMALGDTPPIGLPNRARQFNTTHWSVILAARDGDSEQAALALEHLCCNYWYPLYSYLRRNSYSPHDAQDLTQSFLAHLIEKRDLASVSPERGKFRSFLLVALKHFVSDERKKANAQKRGGGERAISIDAQFAESRYQIEIADPATPELSFERQWAFILLDRVFESLRADYAERGKSEIFSALQPALGGNGELQPYAKIGEKLSLTEASVKIAVHRLRKEFGQRLRAAIAETVSTEDEIDSEIRQLIRITTT